MRFKALADANMTLSDVDAIAASAGPGLVGCPRRWRIRREISCPGGEQADLRHQPCDRAYRGHATAVRSVPRDTLALIVSGGHTSLLHVEDVARQHRRGRYHASMMRPANASTRSPACWASHIQAVRILTVMQLGDPHTPSRFRKGSPAKGQQHPYDFSFSGVKTAVARWIEEQQAQGNERFPWMTCASLADSVATVLAKKKMRGCEQYDLKTLIVEVASPRIRSFAPNCWRLSGIWCRGTRAAA